MKLKTWLGMGVLAVAVSAAACVREGSDETQKRGEQAAPSDPELDELPISGDHTEEKAAHTLPSGYAKEESK
jgi:hypothetical protein